MSEKEVSHKEILENIEEDLMCLIKETHHAAIVDNLTHALALVRKTNHYLDGDNFRVSPKRKEHGGLV